MIPWFADWAEIHCQRFALDPERITVNLSDIQDFFDRNNVTLDEASKASIAMAGDPPRLASLHLPALKRHVFSHRAKTVTKPEDKPSSTELTEARKQWREFMESRAKRKERTTA